MNTQQFTAKSVLGQEGGFSLAELLVTMSILGALAGIALPVFLSYKTNAFNASAASDVRNLGLAVLGVSDSNTLADCTGSACETTYKGFEKSPCSRIQTSAVSGDENSSLIIGCCYGGTKGYMFSAVSGTTVEFPLSTGTCSTATL